MNTYEKVKQFLENSNDLRTVRSIAIELLDNSGDYEFSYSNWKKEIDSFLKNINK